MLRNVLFLYNPASGDNPVTDYLDEIVAHYQDRGYRMTLYRLRFDDTDRQTIAAAASESFDHLLLAGGDGTLNYLINLIMTCGPDIPVAVLPVGTENVANDLSIGLEIGIEQARRFLNESKLEDYRASGAAFVEFSGTVQNTRRRIPIGSFEKIIELRLRETFSIIREQLETRGLLSKIETGIVFCGGGAAIPAASEALRGVTGMRSRDAIFIISETWAVLSGKTSSAARYSRS